MSNDTPPNIRPFDESDPLDRDIRDNVFPDMIADTEYFVRRAKRTTEIGELLAAEGKAPSIKGEPRITPEDLNEAIGEPDPLDVGCAVLQRSDNLTLVAMSQIARGLADRIVENTGAQRELFALLLASAPNKVTQDLDRRGERESVERAIAMSRVAAENAGIPPADIERLLEEMPDPDDAMSARDAFSAAMGVVYEAASAIPVEDEDEDEDDDAGAD